MRSDPAAVLTRPAPPPDAVLRYGDHADHVVDLHLPPGAPGRRPLLVLLHGGFWRQEYDRRHTRPMAQALRDAGYFVATPEYRRTGGAGGWPATLDDIATVRERLPALVALVPDRVTPGPPVLLGHSAGGQLAMWWALTAPAPRTAGVVALAPVADLARAYHDRLGGGAVSALMGGSPRRYPDRYAAADPATLLRSDGPQPRHITVVHGADDRQVPAEHSRGLPGVAYVELQDVEHYGLIDPHSAAWPQVLSAVCSIAG